MEPIEIYRWTEMMASGLNRQVIDALVVKARQSTGKQFELVDDRESGLRIRAGERSATWLLCVRLLNGKRSRIKLGSWPAMGVADARLAAQTKKVEVAAGLDPNETKREVARAAVREALSRRNLCDVLDQYQTAKLSELRRGANVRRAIDGKRGLLKAFVNQDIASITRDDVLNAVRVHAKRAPIAANRCLAYASAFFNWCVGQGILETSPAATVKKPSKERERDRYHSIEELREIWDAAGTMGYPFGPLYRLLIVLPMRREEVAAISLPEIEPSDFINAQEAVWTLPSARTKRANALRVSLSNLARSIISEALADPLRPQGSDYVFTTTGDTPVSGFSKAKAQLDAAITRARLAKCPGAEAMPHWVVHDLRTTFSTLACDILLADVAVVDRILNHVASATTSKVRRVYNRSEMFGPRKAVLEQWADLVDRKVIR
jgi:integrase